MNSNIVRVIGGVVVVVVAVVLLVVLKDDGGSGTTTSASTQETVPVIVIEGGKPVGGVRDLSYVEGDRIHFEVESDVAGEIHVHGYDVMKDVEAGGTVSFDFPATIEGVFEAELEDRKQQIAELTVNP
jgi:hypothetical protein